MITATLPLRISDDFGSGAFEAPRGTNEKGKKMLHKGVDILCAPLTIINAPIGGKVTKHGYCYKDDLSYRYVQIKDKKGASHRLFYVLPGIKVGQVVKKNQPIGIAQNIAIRYYDPKKSQKKPKIMLNHIHYEVLVKRKPVDPIDYK